MQLQQTIAAEIQRELLGRELLVHIDEAAPHEAGLYMGRTEADCPDVDGLVYVHGTGLRAGDFVRARVTDTFEYDLVAQYTARG